MLAGATDIALVNFHCAEETIGALSRVLPWHSGTVWVVDNSAQDTDCLSQTQELRAYCADKPGVRMLDSGGNIGFGRACNLAFGQSDAEFFLLLNPDARIEPDGVRAMTALMAQQLQLGGVSPAVYWNTQHSFVLPMPSVQTPAALCGAALRTHLAGVSRFLARRAIHRTQAQMAQTALLPASFLAGAVLMLRRSAVLNAGGLFDPGYFMFFEDSDLSLRLRRCGYKLAVAPHIRAVHTYRHKAFKENLMAESQKHFFSSNFMLFDAQGTWLERIQRCFKPLDPDNWFDVLDGKIASGADFAKRTHHAGVLAWSPSMLMEPAACRPDGLDACSFSDEEWEQLEPGHYVVLLADREQQWWPRWVRFEKA